MVDGSTAKVSGDKHSKRLCLNPHFVLLHGLFSSPLSSTNGQEYCKIYSGSILPDSLIQMNLSIHADDLGYEF
jgi:hypothetical protein